jgi:hypothetical protein
MDETVEIVGNEFRAQDGQRHVTVGFDARQNWLPMANWWPQNGPFLYLLRDDVDRPYSVDKNIWSSVCSVMPNLNRPDDAGPLPPLWDHFDRLVRHLATAADLVGRPHRVIAITLALESVSAAALEWLSLIGPDAPDRGPLDATWTLAGYDVGNPKLLSGLTDAPYHTEQEDVSALIARWAPHLNEHHLFTRFDDARSFIPLVEQRAKRFAPFGVFAIWERR